MRPLPTYSQFKTADEVLRGACHMVAMQIAHEPLLKQTVRNVFYERAMITARPTKKGMKVRVRRVVEYVTVRVRRVIEYMTVRVRRVIEYVTVRVRRVIEYVTV